MFVNGDMTMHLKYRTCLTGMAVAAVALALSPATAPAFETVKWNWNKAVEELVDITVDINATFESDGLVQVEKFQTQVGNVIATSIVDGDGGNGGGGNGGGGNGGGGAGGIDDLENAISNVVFYFLEDGEFKRIKVDYNQGTVGEIKDTSQPDQLADELSAVFGEIVGYQIKSGTTLTDVGLTPEGDDSFNCAGGTCVEELVFTTNNDDLVLVDGGDPIVIDPETTGGIYEPQSEASPPALANATEIDLDNFSIKVNPDFLTTQDALTNLAEIESIATAVGNNQNISADVGVLLHDGQLLYGGYNEGAFDDLVNGTPGTPVNGIDGVLTAATAMFSGSAGVAGDNLYPGVSLALQVAGMLGLIQPATVSASSDALNILNASVDSDATAIGNNISVDVVTTTLEDGNNLLIGDLTQFSYANVGSRSSVQNVVLNNFSNLNPDVLGRSVISSVATAVGNNVSINVEATTP